MIYLFNLYFNDNLIDDYLPKIGFLIIDLKNNINIKGKTLIN